MRFAVETTGRLWSTDQDLDRAALEADFDEVADALAEMHDFEADVSMNLEEAQLGFFIVVEADDSRQAFALTNELMDRALATAGVEVRWNQEAHARPADLVSA